jgi:hypothetical protein
VWAWENPTVWGNYKGANAYVYNEAWGKGAEETLIHNDIMPHAGSKLLLISTSLFLIFSGNASSASTNILKLFVFILSIIFSII